MADKKNLMTRPAKADASKADFKKAFAAGEAAPKKQLTIKLDEDLHRKLKTHASQNGTTITDLISDYIREL